MVEKRAGNHPTKTYSFADCFDCFHIISKRSIYDRLTTGATQTVPDFGNNSDSEYAGIIVLSINTWLGSFQTFFWLLNRIFLHYFAIDLAGCNGLGNLCR